MDPKSRLNLNLKSEERLECLRRPLRRHLATHCLSSSKSDHFFGPFLENFSFFSSQIREKHFFDSLRVGEVFSAKIVSKTDSFVLKAIRSKTRFLNDLSLNWSLVLNTKSDVEINDVVVVVVVAIIRHQKKVFSELHSMVDSDDWTTLPGNHFESFIRSENQFRNPFVLKKKTFSTLLFDNCFETKNESKKKSTKEAKNKTKERKKRKRKDSTSSSSSSSCSSSSSSSSDEKRKKRRKTEKNREKEKKICFVVKKSSKVTSIPGLRDDNPKTTEDDRRRHN